MSKLEVGVYVPLITPFTEDGELDLANFKKQAVRVAQEGIGLVILGSNGEAINLSRPERKAVIKAGREALDEAKLSNIPIIAGTGAGSAHETVELCQDAKEAGADAVIVIINGYFSFALGKNTSAHKQFFEEVIKKSPLPVVIYNFPGAAGGIDLDSDLISELSELDNALGVKLTCGNVGKGARIAGYTQSAEYKKRHPNKKFLIFSGYLDNLYPTLASGQFGAITGTGNVFPKFAAKLYAAAKKAVEEPTAENVKTAQELQYLGSDLDWAFIKTGVPGTKYALNQYVAPGLGGVPRLPIPVADASNKAVVDALTKGFATEKSL